MFNFIKRMYQSKKSDGTYVYQDADIDLLVVKGFLTQLQADEIKSFEQV